MKRTPAIVFVATICLLHTRPALSQQQTYSPLALQRQQQMQHHTPASPGPGPTLYQRHDTWYEFLLKQFNPTDFNYGAWMEERRQVFLDASVRNPYFKYSTAVTILLFVMAMLYAKHRIDHRRLMWVTAEMMTDLYNHDLYSRDVADKAIQKYNDHIERCNRAIEAAEHGLPVGGADSEITRLRSELESVTGERDALRRDRDLAKDELAEKERLLADLSLRLDVLAKKPEANRTLPSPADVRTADQKLVQHINNLQEQLYAAQLANKRLKGEK